MIVLDRLFFCFIPEPRKKNLNIDSNREPFLNKKERAETEKVKTDNKLSEFMKVIFNFNCVRN